VNTEPQADAATLLAMYRVAMRIKQVDDRFIELIKAGQIASPYYSPRGQEIIPAAVCAHLRPDDTLVTIYRGIHDQIAKGIPLKPFMAEFMGRAGGTCKGKGGPMHITHPPSGIMVTTGVVGSGLPIANGLAWAAQLDGSDRVTVCSFGDGASNIGAFHEALNLAALWKLPVIFVCQNNGYAEHTRLELGTAAPIASRAAAYAMPGIAVDGNDPLAMWQVAGEAVRRARSGAGPTLIEARTFRFLGHLLGDDSHYIPADEMARARAADPLPRFRALLIERGIAGAAELAAIERDNATEIESAVQFALASPWPEPVELQHDVTAQVHA
jgi:acetoin:2,6-dichlorophenolindophenol oxidoreductase subunit alpha